MKQCYVQSSFSRLTSQYNYPLLENVHKDSKALKSNTIFICYNIIPDEKVSSIINKPLEQVKEYLISALIKLNELPENFNIEINNIKDIQKINRIFRVSNNERNVRDIEMTLSKMEQLLEKLDIKYRNNNILLDQMIQEASEIHKFLQYSIEEKGKIVMIINRNIEFYNERVTQYKEIQSMKIAKQLIKEFEIPVELIMDKSYNIEIKTMNEKSIKSCKKQKQSMKKRSDLKGKCLTIEDFLLTFPNYNELFQGNLSKLFHHYKEIKLSEKILNYFKLIKQILNEKIKLTKEQDERLCGNIIYYIFIALYDKLFPKTPSESDNLIYKTCITFQKKFIFQIFSNQKIPMKH